MNASSESLRPMDIHGFDTHEHGACRDTALTHAEAHCQSNGLRLTPTRKRVLEILLDEHRALGAYDILARLTEEGQAAQPPVAYRALDFLVMHGFAHKIERLNAYTACAHPGAHHSPAFLICTECDRVAEAPSAQRALNAHAEELGFSITSTVIEALGQCPACQGTQQ